MASKTRSTIIALVNENLSSMTIRRSAVVWKGTPGTNFVGYSPEHELVLSDAAIKISGLFVTTPAVVVSTEHPHAIWFGEDHVRTLLPLPREFSPWESMPLPAPVNILSSDLHPLGTSERAGIVFFVDHAAADMLLGCTLRLWARGWLAMPHRRDEFMGLLEALAPEDPMLLALQVHGMSDPQALAWLSARVPEVDVNDLFVALLRRVLRDLLGPAKPTSEEP